MAGRTAVRVLVAAAVVATATAVGVSTASAGATTSPEQAGIAELMASYSSNYIGSGWTAAVNQSTLESYQQATGDTTYYNDIVDTYTAHVASDGAGMPDFENHYMDDTAWWGLAWLRAYVMTRDSRFLQVAEADANYDHQFWTSGTGCSGGIYWNDVNGVDTGRGTAVTNEVFLELTAWLHNVVPNDTTYLNWAEADWSYISSSGLINTGTNLVGDHLVSGSSGCTVNETYWTYNQGSILAGLAQLYTATGDSSLLTEAENIADAAISSSGLTENGVLTEKSCSATAGCNSDQQAFKGIFVRDLQTLAATAGTTQYSSFLQTQASSVITADTGSSSRFGVLWNGGSADPACGTNNSCTSVTQGSAEAALVATGDMRSALALDPTSTHVAFIDPGGEVADDWSNNGWQGPALIGGTARPDSPIAIEDDSSHVVFFAPDGQVMNDWVKNGAWTGPAAIGGTARAGSPIAISGDGSHVFFIASNGQVMNDWATSTGWRGPAAIGGTARADSPLAVSDDGSHVVFVDPNGAIENDWSNNGWQGPALVGGTAGAGSPIAIDAHATHVVFIDASGAVVNDWSNNGWHGPAAIGGTARADSPIAIDANSTHVVYVAPDGEVMNDWSNNGWHGPAAVGGTARAGSPIAIDADSSHVIFVDTGGQVVNDWSNNGWQGPALVGGTAR